MPRPAMSPEFFTYGNHELGVFVDSTGVVAESSEADNNRFHTFAWSHHSGIAAPAIVPSAFDLMLVRTRSDRTR